MGIRPGVYRMREIPAPGVDGMYATAESTKGPIRAQPAISSFMHRQLWCIEPFQQNQENTWRILPAPSAGPGDNGWGYQSLAADEPVLLSYNPDPFIIKKQGDDIYVIGPVCNLTGMQWVVVADENTSDEPQLQFKLYPIGATELPAW